ncbi:MAG: cupredoxin domain-containing protein [Armatimonadota bacterium]|nr:cupredoxin domain-containing protein [Armatimonadota bacterium]
MSRRTALAVAAAFLAVAASAVVAMALRPGPAGPLRVTAGPGMRFGERVPGPVLRVRAGQRVRVVLQNRDSLQHDLWVVQAGERAPYLEPAFPGAKTALLEPGQRQKIQFTPTRPGRYRYVCTVPGHDATMFGEFIVE